MATIRHAGQGDASAIAAIWNPVIRDTAVTFSSVERTPADVAALIAARPGAFFVAEADALLGFASFAQFRPGPGYAHTMEHSIMLAPEARGQGIGRALMAAEVAAARAGGVHVMLAAISGENAPALAFHAALGFAEVARMPEVGRKFGRWLDLVLMQLRL